MVSPRERARSGPATAGSRTVTVPVRPSMTAGPEVLSSVRIPHMPATARTTRTSVIRYAPVDPPGAEADHPARGVVAGRGHGTPSASRRKIASGLVAGAGGRLTPASGTARRLAKGERRVLLVRRLSWPRPGLAGRSRGGSSGACADGSLAAAGRRRAGADWHKIWLGQVEPQPPRLTEDRVPSRSSGPPGRLGAVGTAEQLVTGRVPGPAGLSAASG